MKKIAITLFVAMILFSYVGQSKHLLIILTGEQSPETLFKRGYNNLLQQENDNKCYLKEITILTPANYIPKMDSVEFRKVKFTMNYLIEEESELSRSYLSYVAHFAIDGGNVNYTIFESHDLNNWIARDNISAPFELMSFQSTPSKFSFVGYSDNETLLAVKVLNCAKEHFDFEKIVLREEE